MCGKKKRRGRQEGGQKTKELQRSGSRKEKEGSDKREKNNAEFLLSVKNYETIINL